MALVAQLKSRRVFRAIVGYGVVAFALLQIIEPLMHGLHLPDLTLTVVLIGLGVAFPLVVAVAWLTGEAEVPVHVHPAWIAGAGVALLAAAGALLVARRTRKAPRTPTLVQLTFTGGIEDYPAWSPDGKRILYVAQAGRVRKIFRKDLESGQSAQITQGEADDVQPAWSPDGTTVLFVRAQGTTRVQPGDIFGVFLDGDLWALDVASGREERLATSAFNPAWSPDGSRIAVDASWAGPRRIWVLDRLGHNPRQVTTDKSEEVAHVAPSWSPDGKKIVFQTIERTKQDIRVVDLASEEVRSITDDLPNDVRPVWSPSGKFIYFSSDRGGGWNVWRAPNDGDGPLQQITTGAGQDVDVALSPDGTRLAFATLRQNADLWRLPVAPATGLSTGAPEEVIATTREDSRGAIAPDGGAIAFNSDRSGTMNIWIHSMKDGAERVLTFGPGGDFQPQWSPDGREIVFFSSRSGTPDIWKVEVATGQTTRLTPGGAISVAAFYSPDGRWIAFQSDRTGRAEVWVVPSGGGEARQLTRTGVSGHFIRWHGDRVVYRCPCGGNQQILSVPVTGGDPVRLADIKGGSHMSFSPDFSRIMDVLNHRTLWVSPMQGGAPEKVFEFAEPNVRIDYPVWSPDGKYVLFDRLSPAGGDVWMLRDVE